MVSLVLSGPLSRGLTIDQGEILDDDRRTLEVIKESLQDQETELTLDWITEDGETKNLLEEAISNNSSNSIEHVLYMVKNKLVPLDKTATSLKKCWKDLCNPRFSEILGKALSDNTFVFETCRFLVHVDFLNSTRRRLKVVHIISANSFLEWNITRNQGYHQRSWRSQNKTVIKEMQQRGNKSKTEASLRFVCIEDAAKPGMDGTIRTQLMHRAPARFFQSDIVKWVIQHKWHGTWEKRVNWALLRMQCSSIVLRCTS